MKFVDILIQILRSRIKFLSLTFIPSYIYVYLNISIYTYYTNYKIQNMSINNHRVKRKNRKGVW